MGDAIGLPMEGLRASRIARLGWCRELKHRFVFGRGMMSDDTEHTLMVAQSWLQCQGDLERFRRSFAWRLRWWILGLPAGVGMATARAAGKLWFGVSPKHSGVWSAGNGGAMRVALLGVVLADEPNKRRQFTEALVEITHRDPRAAVGARAVVEMVAYVSQSELSSSANFPSDQCLEILRQLAPEDAEWQRLVHGIGGRLSKRNTASRAIGQASAANAVSVALFIKPFPWPSTRGSIIRAILGEHLPMSSLLVEDTDTVAAITGALCGATHGAASIPKEWLDGLTDWPRGRTYIQRLAHAVSEKSSQTVSCSVLGILPRNLFFLILVLGHGVLRYLPGGLHLLRK